MIDDFLGQLDPDTKALLEAEKGPPPLSASHRARLLHRANASAEELEALPIVLPAVRRPSTRFNAPVILGSVGFFVLGASAAAFVVSARELGGLQDGNTTTGVMLRRPVSGTELTSPQSVAAATPPARELPERRRAQAVPRPPAKTPQSRATASLDELLLVESARQALAQRDFTRALTVLDEHGRRFKTGRMAEECGALRVKALVGAGLTRQARREAAAFSARYPQSPLRSLVEESARAAL